jgi:hypothetical protein
MKSSALLFTVDFVYMFNVFFLSYRVPRMKHYKHSAIKDGFVRRGVEVHLDSTDNIEVEEGMGNDKQFLEYYGGICNGTAACNVSRAG